jgi:hypothetical protein
MLAQAPRPVLQSAEPDACCDDEGHNDEHDETTNTMKANYFVAPVPMAARVHLNLDLSD